MKLTFKNIGLLIAMLSASYSASAYSFEVDGIYYNLIDETSVSVTYKDIDDGKSINYSNYIGKIVIPSFVIYNNETYCVTSIGKNAFRFCNSLTSITIPNTITRIDYGAFWGCVGLTSVAIPNSVTSIGHYAFSDCDSLNGVYIDDIVKWCEIAFSYLSSNPLFNCGNLYLNGELITDLVIPNSVTSIGSYAFANCTGLTSVTIPNNVTHIGQYAFSYCSGLTSVTIHNGITSISDGVFRCCDSLVSVTIPDSVTSIGNYAFDECYRLSSLTIPCSVTSISDNAFRVDKAFWLPNTPPKVDTGVSASINYVANEEYNLSNQKVYPFLSSKFSVDGIVYIPVSPSERTCDIVDCVYNADNPNIVIEEQVSNLGITLTINNINDYIFTDNIFIETLDISINGFIPIHAFSGCKSLNSVTLGDKVSGIGNSAFSNCSSLSNIVIPNNVTSIGNCAFDGCTSLADVTFEDGKEGNNVIELGYHTLFSDCPLDEVYIGRKLSYSTSSYDGYSPFYGNKSLRSVIITDKETEIYDNEFYGCSNLKSLQIGNGVTKIGKWAFSGCSSLDYFSAGSKVESIGEEAFSDCTALTNYYSFSAVPPVCGTQALDDINKWTCTLHVPAESKDKYKSADQWKEFFFIDDSGVEDVIVDESIDALIEVFNLNGVKVGESTDNLPARMYIVRKGNKVEKIIVQ